MLLLLLVLFMVVVAEDSKSSELGLRLPPNASGLMYISELFLGFNANPLLDDA